MGQIVVIENVTLDGVMQAPGRPDEDPSDGFAHGGWAVRYDMGEDMEPGAAALLFGRRTYTDFAGHWPHRTDGNKFTPVLDAAQKYVVSNTMHDPLPWRNSTVVRDLDEVAALRERHDALVVLGSGELVRALMRQDLLDVLILRIHPLVLGSGRRLFDDRHASLQLVDQATTSTGVITATYVPERSA